jgi:autotransporter family porin
MPVIAGTALRQVAIRAEVIVPLMSHRAAPAHRRLGSCRLGWIVVSLALIAAGLVGCATTGRLSQASVYFHTLPPGAQLPSGAYCANLVNSSPLPENRSGNKQYNSRKGRHVGVRFLAGDGPWAKKLAKRINGDFTGTTIDILRWAACKWGINQDIVFAQAAAESWWQQDTLGGWTTHASTCPPGNKPGQDGKPGECPVTYGILQNTYGNGGWPAIARSTAMNADAAYAIWRACYDGYETWLNTMPRGGQYQKGDVWGCLGAWFAGQWRNPPALGYIAQVKEYLREKIWLRPNFRW